MATFTTVNPVTVGDNIASTDHQTKLVNNNIRLRENFAVQHEFIGAGHRAGRHISLARATSGGTCAGDSAEHTLLSFIDTGGLLAGKLWEVVCVFGAVAAVWRVYPDHQTTITEYCKAATGDLSGGAFLNTGAGGAAKYVAAEPALPWVGFNWTTASSTIIVVGKTATETVYRCVLYAIS